MNWYQRERERIKTEYKNDPARVERFLKQFDEQGWCDEETWSLDASIARLILPRLKRFQELVVDRGFPSHYLPDDFVTLEDDERRAAEEEAKTQYMKDLDELIWVFGFIGSDRYYMSSREDNDRIEKGLQLFVKLYGSLWW